MSNFLIKWRSHRFEVKPHIIRSLEDMSVKASMEAKDKSKKGFKYVAYKKGEPMEVKFTTHLSRMTGVNVYAEVKTFLTEAQKKDKKNTGYLYVQGQKMFNWKFRIIQADVKNIEIAGNGTWVGAEVSLTFKRCSYK